MYVRIGVVPNPEITYTCTCCDHWDSTNILTSEFACSIQYVTVTWPKKWSNVGTICCTFAVCSRLCCTVDMIVYSWSRLSCLCFRWQCAYFYFWKRWSTVGTKILCYVCHECALKCLSYFVCLMQSDVSQVNSRDIFGTSDLIKLFLFKKEKVLKKFF